VSPPNRRSGSAIPQSCLEERWRSRVALLGGLLTWQLTDGFLERSMPLKGAQAQPPLPRYGSSSTGSRSSNSVHRPGTRGWDLEIRL
jgi:hypothetical protein